MKVTEGIHGAQRMNPKACGALARGSLTFYTNTTKLIFVVLSEMFDRQK